MLVPEKHTHREHRNTERREAAMSAMNGELGMGWLPDYPDFRDYTPEHTTIAAMLKKAKVAELPRSLAASADLRAWCSPIENQLFRSTAPAQSPRSAESCAANSFGFLRP